MHPLRKWKIVRVLLGTVYLTAGWLLFAGPGSLWTTGLGVFFSFVVALVAREFFIEEDEADRRSHLFHVPLIIVYGLYLVFKMYQASFAVAWRVLTRRFNPRVVHFRTRLKSDIARVALANSITLTPGTIVLALDDDHLVVHWLDAATTHSRLAGESIKGRFEDLLKRIWI